MDDRRGHCIPLTQGTITYDLPSDTIDLLEHVIRTGTGTNPTRFKCYQN